jgi:SAM-dependent methyltransferase
MSEFCGEDLASVHAAGFTDLARAAAGEVITRLSGRCRIVEFGCGDGTTARQLSDAGHQVHGFDVTEAMIRLTRRREPRATFEVGSFVDAEIPPCSAVIAIGEVFGYLAPDTGRPAALGSVFARCHEALVPGGLLMFDLAGPGRLQAREQGGWTAGPGWVVLVKTHVESDTLIREIVTFRDCGRSRYRRSHEIHRLHLHRPADVLAVAAQRVHGAYAASFPSPLALDICAHEAVPTTYSRGHESESRVVRLTVPANRQIRSL